MYKIINYPGLVCTFEGVPISDVTTKAGIVKKTPVSVQIRGNPKSRIALGEIDAFNVLDIFVVSEKVLSIIKGNLGKVIPRRAHVFFKGEKLEREYYVLFIDMLLSVGTLSAVEADWLPDANYPVKKSLDLVEPIALDLELKFPVISRSLQEKIAASGSNVLFREYPRK